MNPRKIFREMLEAAEERDCNVHLCEDSNIITKWSFTYHKRQLIIALSNDRIFMEVRKIGRRRTKSRMIWGIIINVPRGCGVVKIETINKTYILTESGIRKSTIFSYGLNKNLLNNFAYDSIKLNSEAEALDYIVENRITYNAVRIAK